MPQSSPAKALEGRANRLGRLQAGDFCSVANVIKASRQRQAERRPMHGNVGNQRVTGDGVTRQSYRSLRKKTRISVEKMGQMKNPDEDSQMTSKNTSRQTTSPVHQGNEASIILWQWAPIRSTELESDHRMCWDNAGVLSQVKPKPRQRGQPS